MRAVCTLVPGVQGVSENIKVRSVLGRFLEHSRLYCFEAGERKTYLLGSADLMPRNLDHRIEVVVPVEDQHVRNELESIFKALLADNRQAWELARRILAARAAEEERTPPFGSGVVHAAPRSRSTPGARALRRRLVGSSPSRDACRGRRRRLEHRAPADQESGPSIRTEREMLRLGADVELHGRIPEAKLDATRSVVEGFAAIARDEGVQHLEILITSPGRQAANGDELAETLAEAADCPVRVLSAPEEGRLAFLGAVEAAEPPSRRVVAVVDVGGGSAQVVVGTRRSGPQWLRSIDLGSQRLTSRLLSADPPGAEALERARAEVETISRTSTRRCPRLALAVGGSARAAKRIVGSRLGAQELREVLSLLAVTPTDEVGDRFGIGDERARTLAAGVVILAGLQARLDTPLRVVRSGLRDGALIDLAARRAAA